MARRRRGFPGIRTHAGRRKTIFVNRTMKEIPPHSPVDPANPWVGLSTFTEEQHAFFHGRDAEIEELLRLLRREPLTVLFGLSGLGKSSLLRAGVFPALRSDGWLPVAIRLDHSSGAADPLVQIRQAIIRAVGASGHSFARPPGDDESLWQFFHSRDAGVRDAAGDPVTVLLAFDQFEEIFTLGKSADAAGARRDALLGELADLLGNRVPKPLGERIESNPDLVENLDFDSADCRVLVSLREDYLADLESLRTKMPLILQNRMRLRPMDGVQAMRAVVEPGGGLVGPEVAGRIVRFVSRSRHGDGGESPDAPEAPLESLKVEPSLLSLFCFELNTRRIAQGLGEITPELLASSSGRILQDFYEQCFDGLPQAARAFIEDELLTDTGFRENMALPSARKRLVALGVAPPDPVIETLVMRRLLHIEERQDLQRIELTHDVLTDVVMKSRSERHLREQEEEARRREAEREERVAQARERERNALRALRGTRRRSAFFALLSLLALAGLTVALVSYREAMRQGAELEKQKRRETELAAAARRDASLSDMITASTITRGNLARAGNAVALLCRAVERDPTNRAAFVSLLSILGTSSWPLQTMPVIALPDSPGGAAFGPDGRQIVVFYGNSVGVWDADGTAPGAPMVFPGRVLGAKFAPGGDRLVVVLQDGTVAIRPAPGSAGIPPRDIPLGGEISSVKFSRDRGSLAAIVGGEIRLLDIESGGVSGIRTDGTPITLRLTPDGDRIAAGIRAADGTGRIRVWRTADGTEIAPMGSRQDAGPLALAFSPDGASLASSNRESVTIRQENGARTVLKLSSEATCLEFSPDGCHLAAGARKGEVVIAKVPEIDHNLVVAESTEPAPAQEIVRTTWGSPVVSMDFGPDAMRAIIATADGTVWLIDVAEIRPAGRGIESTFGTRIGRAGGWIKSQPIRQNGEIVTAKFGPDGRRVIVAGKNNAVRVWDILPNDLQPALLAASAPAASLAVAEAGAEGLVATVADDGSCAVWKMSGSGYAPVPAPAVPAMAAGFDPSGSRLWTASRDGAVTLWNADDATPAGVSLAHPARPAYARIERTTGGDVLVTACGREIRLLPLSGSAQVFAEPGSDREFHSAAVNADGTLLAAAAADRVVVWNIRTPDAPPLVLPMTSPATRLAFVPGGSTLAVASGRRVLLFEPGATRPSASLSHAEDVTWMHFLPDGTLVTCSAKEVWQWRGSVPVGDALVHQSPIASAAVSPDGDFLITGCEDESVRIWELDSGLLICERGFSGRGVPTVAFNADASAFFTVFGGKLFAWDFPGRVASVPDALPALGFAISGTEFSGNRVRVAFSDVSRQLASASSGILRVSPPGSWPRWLARITENDRPVAPGSALTREALAGLLVDSGSPENLRRALLLSPLNVRALEKLSAILGKNDPADPRAKFFNALAEKQGR
jgi:WD40 repeat protein